MRVHSDVARAERDGQVQRGGGRCRRRRRPLSRIGGQPDVDGGDDFNGGGDKRSRGNRPALQQRPAMGVKAAKRMRNNKEKMQESAGVLGVELVR